MHIHRSISGVDTYTGTCTHKHTNTHVRSGRRVAPQSSLHTCDFPLAPSLPSLLPCFLVMSQRAQHPSRVSGSNSSSCCFFFVSHRVEHIEGLLAGGCKQRVFLARVQDQSWGKAPSWKSPWLRKLCRQVQGDGCQEVMQTLGWTAGL